MQESFEKNPKNQAGFTLIELMFAMLVLVVGVVAVAQLVPFAVGLDAANRQDSTALVIAQRMLGQMLDQRLDAGTCTAPACPDAQGTAWSIGDPNSPGQLIGSAVNTASNPPMINFAVAPAAGYSFNYVDPNDPFQLTYDVRWAVVTLVNANGGVTSKRFVLGVRRLGGRPVLPVTLDTMVAK